MASSTRTAQTNTYLNSPPISEINSTAEYLRGVAQVLHHLPCSAIDNMAEFLFQAYTEERTIFVFGNGGSAGLASHFACDLAKGTAVNGNRRFRVMSLTDNIPLMTAWANDARYEDIFAEQMRNFVQPQDLAFAISGSGNSPNVLNALQLARQAGAFTLGLAGFQGGKMKDFCDLCVVVPSDNMQIIEDLHLSISHCVFSMLRNRIARLSI
jgi:D-sedoheptulose 7-phosphate isomerase